MLVAGEPSGDALGAALMLALQDLTGGGVRFTGVGGPLMEARGLQSLFPMHELSLMGIAEILPKVPMLRRRLLLTVATVPVLATPAWAQGSPVLARPLRIVVGFPPAGAPPEGLWLPEQGVPGYRGRG